MMLFLVWSLLGLLALPGQAGCGKTDLPRFSDGSRSSGLDAFFLSSGEPEKKYIVEANSAGVCLFDYDADGLVDVYLVNGGSLPSFKTQTPSSLKNGLFRNLGNRKFQDVTQISGTAGNGQWGMGCSVADFDSDGRLDLYVTTYGSNILYRNKGDGAFEDVTAAAGVDDKRWSTGSAWADFDGDGDLDLFVANYIDLDPAKLPEPGSPSYGTMGPAKLGCQFMGLPVICGPRGLKGAGDSFFVNLGNGRFQEASRQLGMDDPQRYYGLGAQWCDLNNDGYPDLYVANDATPNLLYRNKGDGSFEEMALLAGVATSEQGLEQAGMGVACGDYRNDGTMSIYVTNFSEEYNTLYQGDGQLNFSDTTARAGLSRSALPYVGWGTFFFDYDNDGWLDLFVANGHVFPEADRVTSPLTAGYAERDLLFHNLKNGRFEEVGESEGLTRKAVSRGAVFADLDNDGALDIVVSNLDSTPTLLWNRREGSSHYLQISLEGAGANRFAVGAKVRVQAGGKWQSREVQAGGSYLSHNDLRVHFGLDSAATVETVEVKWPGGKVTVLQNIPADQLLVIREEG